MRRWIALLLTLTCLCPAAALAEAPAETDPSGEAQQTEALDPSTLAPGYVFVSAATVQGWLPLPTEGEQVSMLTETKAEKKHRFHPAASCHRLRSHAWERLLPWEIPHL